MRKYSTASDEEPPASIADPRAPLARAEPRLSRVSWKIITALLARERALCGSRSFRRHIARWMSSSPWRGSRGPAEGRSPNREQIPPMASASSPARASRRPAVSTILRLSLMKSPSPSSSGTGSFFRIDAASAVFPLSSKSETRSRKISRAREGEPFSTKYRRRRASAPKAPAMPRSWRKTTASRSRSSRRMEGSFSRKGRAFTSPGRPQSPRRRMISRLRARFIPTFSRNSSIFPRGSIPSVSSRT
ncbi:MAG: hypothetical protein BWY88_01352 [Synergistetes bacterium ADurb.Bin520]|nr:MAG: hypothetical protein BWY88_01352 [Synergistetes bacterium ADurb.Bin520]